MLTLTPVTPGTSLPFSAIVKLVMTYPGTTLKYEGTGVMVDSFHVMTAGHNVYSGEHGGWASSITVTPALNGSSQPFGTARSTMLRTFTTWMNYSDTHGNSTSPDAMDIGMITLDQTIGKQTGSFGFGTNYDSAFAAGSVYATAGYPGADGYDGKHMYYSSGRVDGLSSGGKAILYHDPNITSHGGQSGSPLWSGNNIVYGIIVSAGFATRITSDIYNQFVAWQKADPTPGGGTTVSPPTVVNRSFTMQSGTSLTIAPSDLLVGSTSPGGGALSIVNVSSPTAGTLTKNANGSYTYTPYYGYSGTATFTFQATDGSRTSNVATVSIAVQAPASTAFAANQSYTVSAGSSLRITKAMISTGSYGFTTFNGATALTNPRNGALTQDLFTGEFTYTPAAGFTGVDSFQYQLYGSSGLAYISSNIATVTITVTASGAFAANKSYTMASGTSLKITAAMISAGSHGFAFPGGAVALTNPRNGTLTQDFFTGDFTYTPAAGFTGVDSFQYQMIGDMGITKSNAATVSITVTAPAQPPVTLITYANGYLYQYGPNTEVTLIAGAVRSASFAYTPSGDRIYEIVQANGDLYEFQGNSGRLAATNVRSATACWSRSLGLVYAITFTNGLLWQVDKHGSHLIAGDVKYASLAYTPDDVGVYYVTRSDGSIMRFGDSPYGRLVIPSGAISGTIAYLANGAQREQFVFSDGSLWQSDSSGPGLFLANGVLNATSATSYFRSPTALAVPAAIATAVAPAQASPVAGWTAKDAEPSPPSAAASPWSWISAARSRRLHGLTRTTMRSS